MAAKAQQRFAAVLEEALRPGQYGEYGVKVLVKGGAIQKISRVIQDEDTREADGDSN
jgi:hypothetical protein